MLLVAFALGLGSDRTTVFPPVTIELSGTEASAGSAFSGGSPGTAAGGAAGVPAAAAPAAAASRIGPGGIGPRIGSRCGSRDRLPIKRRVCHPDSARAARRAYRGVRRRSVVPRGGRKNRCGEGDPLGAGAGRGAGSSAGSAGQGKRLCFHGRSRRERRTAQRHGRAGARRIGAGFRPAGPRRAGQGTCRRRRGEVRRARGRLGDRELRDREHGTRDRRLRRSRNRHGVRRWDRHRLRLQRPLGFSRSRQRQNTRLQRQSNDPQAGTRAGPDPLGQGELHRARGRLDLRGEHREVIGRRRSRCARNGRNPHVSLQFRPGRSTRQGHDPVPHQPSLDLFLPRPPHTLTLTPPDVRCTIEKSLWGGDNDLFNW